LKRPKSFILSLLYFIKRFYSIVKFKLGIKTGLIRSIMIMPYKGFGNEREIYFVVRVIRDRKIGLSNENWHFQISLIRTTQSFYNYFLALPIQHTESLPTPNSQLNWSRNLGI